MEDENLDAFKDQSGELIKLTQVQQASGRPSYIRTKTKAPSSIQQNTLGEMSGKV